MHEVVDEMRGRPDAVRTFVWRVRRSASRSARRRRSSSLPPSSRRASRRNGAEI